MGEAALSLVTSDEVMKEVISIEDQAKALKIVSRETYIKAGELWKAIKAIRAKVAETFDGNIKKAHELHKSLVAEKKRHDGPLDEAERMVKRGMSDFDLEQERIRREEQARLEAIARAEEEARRKAEAERIEAERKAEEERLMAAAQAAEAAGDKQTADALAEAAIEVTEAAKEEVAAVVSEPVTVAPVVLPKATPKLQGGPVYREVWSAECVDVVVLCRAVSEGKASRECVLPNMPALNKMATALKNTMNIPGIRAVSRRV